jgi:WD40 repeat protein
MSKKTKKGKKMNNSTLLKVKRWQHVSLLICVYTMLLAFELMATPIQSPPISEAEIENPPMMLDKKNGVTSIAFNSNGSLLAYGSLDNTIRLWDTHSGKLLNIFEGHTQPVTSVAFSPNGNTLASSSEDQTIRLWNIDSQILLRTFSGNANTVSSVDFHPEGNILASSANGGEIRLWDVNSGELIRKPFKWISKYMRAVTFSPDGKMLATGSSDLKIRLWRVNSFKMYKPPLIRLKCTEDQHVTSLDFSPDSQLLASGFREGLVCIWDTRARKLITQMSEEPKTGAFTSVAFRADGKMLAYSLYDAIYLWKTSTEKPEKPVKLLTVPDEHYIRAVKFHPNATDQNILAYGSSDGTVRLWDTQGNHLLSIFAGNNALPPEQITPISPTQTSTQDEETNNAESDKELETGVPTEKLPSQAPIPAQKEEIDKTESERNGAESNKELETGIPTEKPPSQAPIPVQKEEIDKTESERDGAESDKDLETGIPTEKPPSQAPIPVQKEEKEDIDKTEYERDNAESNTGVDKTQSLFLEYGFYIAVCFLILLLLVAAIALYRRSIIHHADLLETPLPQLLQKHQLLKRARSLDPILAKKQISAKIFNDAIAFVQTTSPLKQTKILATRLEAKHWEQTEEDLFMVVMHENFPINLPFFSLYFLTPDQTIGEIVDKLRQHRNLAIQKVIVITQDFEQRTILHSHIKEMSLSWVVPDDIELTKWLLSPDPVRTFVQTLAMQLNVSQISPYQTRSGINKDAAFFGRAKILTHIFNRDPANYLIIGGRQLGKSSLLKYIHRHYQNHPQVQCRYLTLHSDTLQGQLASTLDLPSDSDLDSVLTRLAEVAAKQQQLLLIDQADHFIQAEMKSGYPTLNHFRSLSEEGYCHFILAGFWDLYEASVLDNQSPLKNFGESITIAELEADACRDLAIKPMQIMELRYESDTLVEKLITETGQRASLIATVCNELLKNIGDNQRVFTEENIVKALNSNTVQEALRGWQATSSDDADNEPTNRLERIIVYATIKQGEFHSAELRELLTELGCSFTAEQIKQSLERLVLSFVIKRESQGRFVYCVPLFRRGLLEDEDVDDLLRWELKDLN